VKLAIAIAVVVVLAVAVSMLRRGRGYRGAIGFKNRHATEIATIRLTGFSKPVECRTLRRGEHSFNYLGRQDMPSEVQIAWRFVGDASDKTARVSLNVVPKGAADGELFFGLSADGAWVVEYAPELRLDKLQSNAA